ncbi:glycosyl transferase family protein [Sandaracinobacter neustonicus]|uniref:glycosyl transferase family protein n=1 Tax=Sandaracinobacter neustonicus TaxID=1715348 RepID=UPI0015E2C8FD|nr:glycosyl transferase family protein [Sandaracinobacter neustonicus]
MIELVPVLAILAILTRELLWLTACGIFLSSLDDIAVDLLWLGGFAFRRERPLPPLPPEPGRFALIVPAWDESAVIGAMVGRLCQTIQNPRLRIFVGVYPNDPATLAAVQAVGDDRVQAVITSRAGPTTKADCLNHLWRGVLAHEARTGQRFKAVVLHDAEDVVDPASLDLYDRCIPALAMVQVPVLPIQDPETRWVSGHYCDEFAQAHAKDMMVRGLLGAPVPSAGVGTAIERDVLARLAGPGNAPFDAASLTEDYEMGTRVHRLGLKGRMVRAHVGGRLVATRAYFPATIDTAVRQKSRWLTGIALSGWDRLGWDGGLATRWMLARDRKGLFTAAIAMLGYAVAVLVLLQLALRAWVSARAGVPLPPLIVDAHSILPGFLMLNAVLLGWRLVMRAGFTGAAYGWREGLFAMPRAVLANAINFLAAIKAVTRYRQALGSGAPPEWGKTEHRFPDAGVETANG